MARIQIAGLQATGTELFQGNESFLTELQPVEANAIRGGKKCTGNKSKSSDGCKIGKSSKKSTGKSSDGGCGGPGPGPSPSPLPSPIVY
jgi:hypothetical protein